MSKVRILLVEDDPLIRLIASEALLDEGFDVVEAEHGDAAASLLDADPPFDAICTDVRMPSSLDGVDVAILARSKFPTIPLLIVTGYSSQLGGRLNKLRPAAVVMTKPYSMQVVVTTLRQMVSCA